MGNKTLEGQDVILGAIEKGLKNLINRESLANETMTRWRWDQPEVMLVWLQDNIYRNIVAHVAATDSFFRITFEVNAWQDIDVEYGATPGTRERARRWANIPFGEIKHVSPSVLDNKKEELVEKIEKCYLRVKEISEKDLSKTAKF